MSKFDSSQGPEQPEQKAPEYNFNEGLEFILQLVREKLAVQDYVTVAINGSAPQVGKTKFAGELAKKLKLKHWPVAMCAVPQELPSRQDLLRIDQKASRTDKAVVIFNAFLENYIFPHIYKRRLGTIKIIGLLKIVAICR